MSMNFSTVLEQTNNLKILREVKEKIAPSLGNLLDVSKKFSSDLSKDIYAEVEEKKKHLHDDNVIKNIISKLEKSYRTKSEKLNAEHSSIVSLNSESSADYVAASHHTTELIADNFNNIGKLKAADIAKELSISPALYNTSSSIANMIYSSAKAELALDLVQAKNNTLRCLTTSPELTKTDTKDLCHAIETVANITETFFNNVFSKPSFIDFAIQNKIDQLASSLPIPLSSNEIKHMLDYSHLAQSKEQIVQFAKNALNLLHTEIQKIEDAIISTVNETAHSTSNLVGENALNQTFPEQGTPAL